MSDRTLALIAFVTLAVCLAVIAYTDVGGSPEPVKVQVPCELVPVPVEPAPEYLV